MDPASDWVASGGKLALDFDGADDYIQTTARITGVPVTFYTFLYARTLGNTNDRPGFVFFRPTATGLNASYFTPARVGYTWNGLYSNWNGGPLFPLGKNALVAVSITSTQATAYAVSEDGFEQGTNIVTHGALTSTSDIEIGRDNFQNRAARHFDGLIYEAGVYNVALTANEIREIYRLGPGSGVFPEPDFDEGFAAAGFKAHWARRQSQLIGGGV
jgi:hypothetical protein